MASPAERQDDGVGIERNITLSGSGLVVRGLVVVVDAVDVEDIVVRGLVVVVNVVDVDVVCVLGRIDDLGGV